MRNFLVGVFIGILIFVGGYYGKPALQQYIAARQTISPIGKIFEKPLAKYTILNLSACTYTGSQIVLDQATATTSAYTKYPFHFVSDEKKVTGVAHVPNGSGPFPVIVQFRGYVDQEKYAPGAGTRHSAEVFAANGFLSLAPDFLGYGGSDMPSQNVFEERVETYIAALSLLASVGTLPAADTSRVGIWGHSNGGQIALTVLEVLGRSIPTTLWAPVTKPFPYSILYYTDDADDHGKMLRRELAKFEQDYDVELYALTTYLDRLVGPMQIHQGGGDDAVPQTWSDVFVKALEGKENVQYFVYPGADHNMNGAWDTVVTRDITFFRKYLK